MNQYAKLICFRASARLQEANSRSETNGNVSTNVALGQLRRQVKQNSWPIGAKSVYFQQIWLQLYKNSCFWIIEGRIIEIQIIEEALIALPFYFRCKMQSFSIYTILRNQ